MNDIEINYKELKLEFGKLRNNLKHQSFVNRYMENYQEMVAGFNQFKRIIERKLG